MFRELWGLITTMQINDIFDILLVTAIFYFVFMLLRKARSPAALRGMVSVIIIVFLVFFIAQILNLSATVQIFQTFLIGLLLVFLIAFQGELKRALVEVGQIRPFRRFFSPGGEYIEEIIKAVNTMAKRRIGAIVVVERRNSLKVYADTGTFIDSSINSELLLTIFSPYTPLHDGAVIIRGETILAAGCILPLSENPELSRELGTRHRAALGITEETDAIAIVVSEETGVISLAVQGNLQRGLEAELLRHQLQELLEITVKKETEEELA